jgi:hypothetical protein
MLPTNAEEGDATGSKLGTMENLRMGIDGGLDYIQR